MNEFGVAKPLNVPDLTEADKESEAFKDLLKPIPDKYTFKPGDLSMNKAPVSNVKPP